MIGSLSDHDPVQYESVPDNQIITAIMQYYELLLIKKRQKHC
jgi:hypothetical protein